MARSRRKHSAEFKREAVRLSLEPGRTVGQVAANLGIDRGLLQRWRSKMKMKAQGAGAFPGNGRAKVSAEEVVGLRKELARTQQERDIFKNHRAPSRFLLDQKLRPGLPSACP